jgi:predicted metal-dependent peptidase
MQAVADGLKVISEFLGATGTGDNGNGGEGDQEGGQDGDGTAPAIGDKELQQAIQTFIHVAKSYTGKTKLIGNAPGMLAEVLRAVLEPPPPWYLMLRTVLAGMGGSAGKPTLMPDESYLYLMTGHNVWMPSRMRSQLAPILFLVDTSGSVSDEMLQKAVNQMLSAVLAKQVGSVTVACWDTEVYPAIEARGYSQVRAAMNNIRITGRGGTDIRKALEEAGRQIGRKGVQQVVAITDGCAWYPEKAPAWLEFVPMMFITSMEKPPWTHRNMRVVMAEELEE